VLLLLLTGQRRPKTETKASSPEVAFQPSLSPLAIRSFGVPKEDDKPNSDVNPSSPASILPAVSSVTAAQEDGEEVHNFVTRTGDDYVEPWVTRIFR
jgi:DNA-directed RNA polymerase III subunit RPC4